jgi:hypothetical protein
MIARILRWLWRPANNDAIAMHDERRAMLINYETRG